MPFSIKTFCCVGVPSSSTLSDPRRLPMVPSSITVHSGLATCCPMRPLKAETPLRLKSASSPCPTASCNRMPGHPGPSTTVISPAGRRPHPIARWPGARLRARNIPATFRCQEKIERDASAAARVTGLRNTVAFASQHRHVQASHRLAVDSSAGRRWWRPAPRAGCRRSWPAPGKSAHRRPERRASARFTRSTRSARPVSCGLCSMG